MTHTRRTIREAVVTALAAAGTAAGSRVYDHPSDAITTLPALVVTDVAESHEATTLPRGAGRTIERRYTLEVAALVQQTGAYAAARDDLLADVEATLATLAIAGVKDIAPAGFNADQAFDGERPISVGRQRFAVLFYTPQGDPAAFY
mgnify:FL=1